jgi:hypothetical protein
MDFLMTAALWGGAVVAPDVLDPPVTEVDPGAGLPEVGATGDVPEPPIPPVVVVGEFAVLFVPPVCVGADAPVVPVFVCETVFPGAVVIVPLTLAPERLGSGAAVVFSELDVHALAATTIDTSGTKNSRFTSGPHYVC